MLTTTNTNYSKYIGRNMLAIDYGLKVTGLATFRPGNDPFPLLMGKIIYQSDGHLIQEIAEVARAESIDVIILGIPYYLDGKKSKMTKKVEKFGIFLQKELLQIDIHFQDETLSSFEAQDRMKNSARFNFKVDHQQIDALAASIILEDFIKSSCVPS